MKINIDELTAEGLSLDITEEGSNLEKLAGGLDITFLSPVRAHLDIKKTDGNVFVYGDMQARLSLDCSRCLKEFEYGLKTDFSLFYVRGKEEEREKELKTADMDVNYLDGPELDTSELLLGQFSLDVPLQRLCSDECKGLCPRCGSDLNLGDCGCESRGKVDSRLEKLKDFKTKS